VELRSSCMIGFDTPIKAGDFRLVKMKECN
jgi:hypothetical protein